MPRIKRGSAVLEAARQRLAGLKSITPKPNFGSTLDVDQYEHDIEAFSAQLEQYNDTLSLLDRQQNDLDDGEARIKDKNRRMLAATEAQYGPDSNEYEAVGGTRESDRKRSTRSSKKSGNG
jgi:uncharacterized protein YPO0396